MIFLVSNLVFSLYSVGFLREFGPFTVRGCQYDCCPCSHYWNGITGTVVKVDGLGKNNAVETTGLSLMTRIVPQTIEGTVGKRSVTKNAVWLFAASVRVI